MKRFLLFLFVLILLVVTGSPRITAKDYCPNLPQKVYANYSIILCDSLIKANAGNPNFAIIDVRTPAEFLPKHIAGAINRNAYDSDIKDQLNRLDKNKTWLLHCQSGGRSATIFTYMKELEFREVYNMQGGMNSWNSASLPSTSGFAPKLGIYDCAFKLVDTIPKLKKDTINIRITNSANDTLKITSVNFTGGSSFSRPTIPGLNILGSDSYTVQVIFSANQTGKDSLTVSITSNAGNREIKFIRYTENNTSITDKSLTKFELFPSPAKGKVYMKNYQESIPVYYRIIDFNGRIIKTALINSNSIDISDLKNGVYLFQVQTNNGTFTKKIVKTSN